MNAPEMDNESPLLTYWGWDKLAVILQTTFLSAFYSMKIVSIQISLNFVPMGPVNKKPAWVQIMAWWRMGNKPWSEPMMA